MLVEEGRKELLLEGNVALLEVLDRVHLPLDLIQQELFLVGRLRTDV